ncbi:MAG: hypothetical protein IJY31_03545 [Muribaculaceae bacterium]|nr:hypothetical protein [Muribaculaceae bacterium]
MSHNPKKNHPGHAPWGIMLCLLAFAILSLSGKMATANSQQAEQTPIVPTIPGVDRHQKGKVFLEHADRLWTDHTIGIDYQVLIGNVQFRKDDMFMYCDSAHFYDKSNSLDAFGNVRMEQGDTLFVYADTLNYDGVKELAILYADAGKKVRLINRDVQLETDVFNYDLGIDLGYYEVWGVLTDKQNRLESWQGEYSPTTKDANFYLDVRLTSITSSDTLKMFTDTLSYNTATHIAELVCPTEIINRDGTIFSSNGLYNTDNNIANLYDRSLVVTHQGNTLTGDTLFYDRRNGYGEAFGNMILTDSTRQTALEGNYGFYNEFTDSAFVTGRARALEYSRQDTLYLHGDTIRSFIAAGDTTHIMIANPRVRFYRNDIQGVCDSLTFTEKDSILYMNRHPIVWSGSRQIFGNIIMVHMNDSTVDWADLPDFGFMAEHIDEEFYNQLSGKEMHATFENGEINHLDVKGNVQIIMLPEESDSTFNKIFNIESSFLSANFAKRTLKDMIMWPETSGNGTPLYLAKKSIYYLPQFRWYDKIRPKYPDDIFIVPQEMIDLFNQPETSIRSRNGNP